jgi:flagellar motility protein MotE (MotC chaperone)
MFALVAMTTVGRPCLERVRVVGRHWDAGPGRNRPTGCHTTQQAKPAEQPVARRLSASRRRPATPAKALLRRRPRPAGGDDAHSTAGEQPKTDKPMSEEEAAAAAAAAAAEAAPEPKVADPFDYTDEEVDVLQQLAKRREELDVRARQLDEREALIQAAEQRMEQKMAELKALQATVEDLLKTRSEQEEAELKSLVKMYENMKPKAAAKVFERWTWMSSSTSSSG